ncbi:MAG TPA: hypothetical protein VNW28_02220 [Chthoniobacterales bacterium]|nr:hypothetical protein [Chthoniobacterales bacterium]
MATKHPKAKRKSPARKVRDLAARKDPKGGAQKKEGPDDLTGMSNRPLTANTRRSA